MNSIIDLLPGIAFLIALFVGDIFIATAVLIVAMIALAGWHWWRTGKPHKMHTFGAIAVLVLGGTTLLLNDSSFVKYKTSVVNGVIALAFLGSHFIGSKVLLQRIPQTTLQMPDAVWRRVSLAWVCFFAGVALLNLYVMHHFNDQTWGVFKTVGVSVMMFVFMMAHLPFLWRYLPHEEAPSSSSKPG